MLTLTGRKLNSLSPNVLRPLRPFSLDLSQNAEAGLPVGQPLMISIGNVATQHIADLLQGGRRVCIGRDMNALNTETEKHAPAMFIDLFWKNRDELKWKAKKTLAVPSAWTIFDSYSSHWRWKHWQPIQAPVVVLEAHIECQKNQSCFRCSKSRVPHEHREQADWCLVFQPQVGVARFLM